MKTQNDATPFDQKLFLIFIVTFATMTVFEFAGQFLYPYTPDWRSNLITCLFTSGIAVIIAYFPLNNYYENNARLLEEVKRREQAEQALLAANRKLSTLSTITRHDIKNQLTGIGTYLQLVKNEIPDEPRLQERISRMMACSNAIGRQLEFATYYEDLGTVHAGWFDVYDGVQEEARQLPLEGIILDPGKKGISIYSDPLIGRVYFNLLENSLRHGVRVKKIAIDIRETENGLIIRYTDDGVGIPDSEKEKIFLKGYGKNTGLGLFVIREVLAITGITITEDGIAGKGAQFEILVPREGYRISPA